jgi:hypothetical protein
MAAGVMDNEIGQTHSGTGCGGLKINNTMSNSCTAAIAIAWASPRRGASHAATYPPTTSAGSV